MSSDAGYINEFDGLKLVDDGSVMGGVSRKALSFFGSTNETIDRFRKLANGTIVNLDLTNDSGLALGTVEQTVKWKTQAFAFLNWFNVKQGYRGTITKRLYLGVTDPVSSIEETCTGVLDKVIVLPEGAPAIGILVVKFIFKLETDWVA